MSFLSKLTIPHLAVRGIQVFFSLMVLILSAYVANWYNTSTLVASPPQINVMLVSAIFSLLSVALLELLPKFVSFFSNPYLHLAIESANALFWLASGVALAVFLGRLLFCRGGVCAAAQADAVFAYVMFGAWLGTLVPLAIRIVRGDAGKNKAAPGGRGDGNLGAGPTSTTLAPAMTWGSTASLAAEKERGRGKGKEDGFEDV